MPYKGTSDLSKTLQDILPKEAQEIYVGAFNGAYEEYKDPKKLTRNASREAASHATAWAAVKKKFKKGKTGRWVPIR
jgi:cation transport regulator